MTVATHAGHPATRALLCVRDLEVAYGGIQALKGVSLDVHEGEIVTLIGANGAGKTTLLRTISGLVRPRAGTIDYTDSCHINKEPAHRIVKKGLCHVPEGRIVFANLSVRENLQLGAYLRKDGPEVRSDLEAMYELFPRLRERMAQSAGTLSGGEQQMLAIARALMGRPRLLLMDEPSLGLAPLLVQEIFRTIREINGRGMTILLVEQNAHMALSVAHRGYVLETGTIVLQGPASDLASNEDVKKAYLGH